MHREAFEERGGGRWWLEIKIKSDIFPDGNGSHSKQLWPSVLFEFVTLSCMTPNVWWQIHTERVWKARKAKVRFGTGVSGHVYKLFVGGKNNQQINIFGWLKQRHLTTIIYLTKWNITDSKSYSGVSFNILFTNLEPTINRNYFIEIFCYFKWMKINDKAILVWNENWNAYHNMNVNKLINNFRQSVRQGSQQFENHCCNHDARLSKRYQQTGTY